jgi:octaprenyl-diphosphate synthase
LLLCGLNVHKFVNVMNNVASVVDRVLRAALARAPSLLRQPMSDLVAAGGKRLRPRLVVLAAEASGPRRRGVLRLAAAAEAVHSATLLHDDVVDEAPTRRGQPSAPAEHGNPIAVLAGDWMFTFAIDLVRRSGHPRVLTELLEAIRAMVEAEALQQEQRKAPRFDEARCLEIISGKTVSLFRWCALAGARAAGATEAHAQALAAYATHVGTAFQLLDDLEDLCRLEEDLAQGWVTLPLVLALREQPSLPRTAEAVLKTSAPAQVAVRIAHELELAQVSLRQLPHSVAREQLASVAAQLTPKSETEGATMLKLGKFVKFREEKFGGVLFETRQERVFSLNPTAAAVVKEIVAGHDVVETLKARFDDPNGELGAHVTELINSLEQQGLLVRA